VLVGHAVTDELRREPAQTDGRRTLLFRINFQGKRKPEPVRAALVHGREDPVAVPRRAARVHTGWMAGSLAHFYEQRDLARRRGDGQDGGGAHLALERPPRQRLVEQEQTVGPQAQRAWAGDVENQRTRGRHNDSRGVVAAVRREGERVAARLGERRVVPRRSGAAPEVE
jgi:hypothetical protein